MAGIIGLPLYFRTLPFLGSMRHIMPINKYFGIRVKILYRPKKNQRQIFINIYEPPYCLDYNIIFLNLAVIIQFLNKKNNYM